MARKNLFIIFVALILTLTYSNRASALFMWVDEKGQTHISDHPKPGSPQETEPSDSETNGKATLPDSHGQSSDAVRAPAPAEQPKLTTAPVAAVAPPRNEQAFAVQLPQQLQAGITTTNTIPAKAPEPVPADPGRVPARSIPSNAPRTTAPNNSVVAAAIAAFFSMFLFALVLGYLYFSLCLFLIARKLNVPAAWVAWIPIAQLWTFLAAAGKPGWWALLFLVPIVNIVIPIYLWMCLVENLGREKWLGLLMLVPLVNVVYLGMLAFSGSDGSGNRTAVAA